MMEGHEELALVGQQTTEKEARETSSQAVYIAKGAAKGGGIGAALGIAATVFAAGIATVALGGPHGAAFVAVVAGVGAVGGTGTAAGAIGGAVAGKKRYEKETDEVEMQCLRQAHQVSQATSDSRIAQLQGELAAVNQEIVAVRSELKAESERADSYSILAEKRQERIHQFESGEALQTLTEQRDKYRAVAKELKVDLAEAKARIAVLEKQTARVDGLERALAAAVSERDTLRRQLEEVIAKAEQFETGFNDMREQNSRLQVEHKREMSEMEARMRRLEALMLPTEEPEKAPSRVVPIYAPIFLSAESGSDSGKLNLDVSCT